MLPIGDDDSGRRLTPIVTYALIAGNVLFFLKKKAINKMIKLTARPTFKANIFTSYPIKLIPNTVLHGKYYWLATCYHYGMLVLGHKATFITR